jgi:hypothetical protein
LAAAVDPNKVIFISIDDEDSKTVGTFIRRRKMTGWIALDPGRTAFASYGVRERPATIVVDGAGRVAAVTTPEQLTAAGLMSLAKRSPIPSGSSDRLPPAASSAAAALSEPSVSERLAARTAPLFEISVSPAPHSNGKQFLMKHDMAGNYWWYGVDETFLLLQAYNVPLRRFTFIGPKVADDYNFALELDGLDITIAAPVIRAAVCRALRLDVIENDIPQNAFVMKSTRDTAKLLQPTASTATPPSAGVEHGDFVAVNSSLDDIAVALEDYVNTPVINETHLRGTFDADFPLPSKDPVVVTEAVLKMLGIEVTQEQRTVATFTVSNQQQKDKH